jgi:hypothetical protein
MNALLALLGNGFQSFVFRHVVREVEDELYRLSRVLVIVIAVYVRLELSAVSDDSLPPLLKGTLDMLSRSRSQIGPKSELLAAAFIGSDVLCADAATLGIDMKVDSHGPRKVFGQAVHNR